jgi:hypothetical protein
MLNKWIQEQQQVPTDILDVEEGSSLPPSGTRSNPYLAYPELGSHPFHESVVSVNSYDMMDDDDIPPENEVSDTHVSYTIVSFVWLQDASNAHGDSFPARL